MTCKTVVAEPLRIRWRPASKDDIVQQLFEKEIGKIHKRPAKKVEHIPTSATLS
jgi:hypothetical protein